MKEKHAKKSDAKAVMAARKATAKAAKSTPAALMGYTTVDACGCKMPGNGWRSCKRHANAPKCKAGKKGFCHAGSTTNKLEMEACIMQGAKHGGAFNATHVDKYPRGIQITPDMYRSYHVKSKHGFGVNKKRNAALRLAHRSGCATIVSVKPKKRNGEWTPDMSTHTCTSCRPGYAFVMQYHKSRTGKCKAYLDTAKKPFVDPIKLDVDDGETGLGDKNKLITKVSLVRSRKFNIASLKLDNIANTTKAKKHFDVVAKKHRGKVHPYSYAFAYCQTRKETVCRQSKSDSKSDWKSSCSVRKQVKCVSVCNVRSAKKKTGFAGAVLKKAALKKKATKPAAKSTGRRGATGRFALSSGSNAMGHSEELEESLGSPSPAPAEADPVETLCTEKEVAKRSGKALASYYKKHKLRKNITNKKKKSVWSTKCVCHRRLCEHPYGNLLCADVAAIE